MKLKANLNSSGSCEHALTGKQILADLAVGSRVQICEPAGVAIPERLRDLGLVPGTEVRILRRAPLGDPVELELRGLRLCLRANELACVWGEPLTGALEQAVSGAVDEAMGHALAGEPD